MHGHADEWIANRVKWRVKDFIRQPPDILFVNGDEDERATSLRTVAEDRRAGLPVLAFWRSSDVWTLLGSEKLVWTRDGQLQEVLLDALTWADSPGMFDAIRKEMETSPPDSLAPSRHKFEYEYLRVIDKSGTEFVVWTAPGGGCLILWNVLLMLIRMQKTTLNG
jgi:hypothetical protein